MQPPAVVVRRAAYERLGGFDDRMRSCGEDWEMWARIAAHYPVGYVPEPLAFYRDNPGSLTKRSVRDGQNIRDVRFAARLVRAAMPPGPARRAARRANVNWATWALHWARTFAARGEVRPALVQLREALLCSRDPAVVRAAARIGADLAAGAARAAAPEPARRAVRLARRVLRAR